MPLLTNTESGMHCTNSLHTGVVESSYYPAPPAYTPTPQPVPYPPTVAASSTATVVTQPPVIVQQQVCEC